MMKPKATPPSILTNVSAVRYGGEVVLQFDFVDGVKILIPRRELPGDLRNMRDEQLAAVKLVPGQDMVKWPLPHKTYCLKEFFATPMLQDLGRRLNPRRVSHEEMLLAQHENETPDDEGLS